jgi:NAD(P)-dependent dehydrogenase (short-subunit alcohol dehydrogenase family)
MGELDGKVAVITGGASGIGEATAHRFVAEGAKVVVADMRDEPGQAVADALGSSGTFVVCDVTRPEHVRAAVDTAVQRWGRLDVMFNNAGFGGALGPIDSTSEAEWDITFDVLLKGVWRGIKYAAPVMRMQGSGAIINTASVAGLRAGESPHLYSTAKAAVIQLTRSVALELGAHSIRVNCICPGVIATPLAANRPGASEEQLDRLRQRFDSYQPIGRIGRAEDIAQAALWLASDRSSFVTGEAMVVDGGIHAGRPWHRQGTWYTEYHPLRLYRPEGR